MGANAINRRLKEALEIDDKIVVSKTDLTKHEGFSEQHLVNLGLRKADLKFLESRGLAKRGYIRFKTGTMSTGSRTEVRWVLIGGDNEPETS